MKEYVDTGKVLIVFRHLPLEDLHKNALPAAVASVCAGQQGHFWAAHDILFQRPVLTAIEDIQASSEPSIRLDRSVFEKCLATREAVEAVETDQREAARLGITGTPTFLFGTLIRGDAVQVGAVLTGAKGFEEFREAIEALLR